MHTTKKILIILVLILSPAIKLFSQGDIEDLLYTEVDNLNPVYKPVVGFGIGNFNYMGDVRDTKQNPFNGTLGYKVMLTTFIDNKHFIRADFFYMGGSLSGNERSYKDLSRNMNFKSNIVIFGFDLNYDFDNFYKKYRKVHPFISLGFETMTFNSKADDSTNVEGVSTRYNYWSDGTIRNLPETPENMNNPSLQLMHRDYTYETDLRSGYNWGLGKYPQYTFAFPIDIGLDFWLSDRVMFRVATSYHYTFSDVIDHVSYKNTSGVKGNRMNDSYLYSYFSLHLDLFSSKKTLAVQRLFADVEFDPTLMSDEDNDGWFDGWDQCPGTPLGVETDTTGCPLDNDFDGVPNYLDDELNSRYGAFVNDRGVEISEDELIAKLDNSNAVNHQDAELFIRTPSSYAKYKSVTAKEIPERFRSVDRDNDGYISFDEIMKEIDSFFDFQSNLSSEDIYELNNFFFAQ
jgi:hypothetical protein